MTDRVPLNIKQADLDKAAAAIKNRIRQAVLEINHGFNAGDISGMMSDLRSLNFMQPTDFAPPPEPVKVPTRQEADREQQRASARHSKNERDKIAAENE